MISVRDRLHHEVCTIETIALWGIFGWLWGYSGNVTYSIIFSPMFPPFLRDNPVNALHQPVETSKKRSF